MEGRFLYNVGCFLLLMLFSTLVWSDSDLTSGRLKAIRVFVCELKESVTYQAARRRVGT
jgi:hypothetical protein